MKYGSVASPFPNTANSSQPPDGATATDAGVADKRRKLDLMGATTVRVSLFWGNAWNRRFTAGQLDTLRIGGRTEMILQSREVPNLTAAQHELDDVILPYARANPNTLFVYEIGNEPDVNNEVPGDARVRRMQISQYLRNRVDLPSNFIWAINMPSQGDDGSYFNALVLDQGDGYGNMLTGPNQPIVVTVHCYGYGTLCRTDGNAPYKLIDWVRGWNGGINIKVTEAGIGDNTIPVDQRAARYVEFAEKVTWPQTAGRGGGGNLDSVCFYGTPDVGPLYNINDAFASAIGARAMSSFCG